MPGDSAPAKDAGLGLPPVTDIVKLDAVAVPPLLLMTCLMTISVGAWSSFVTVQVLLWPTEIEPEQSVESERA